MKFNNNLVIAKYCKLLRTHVFNLICALLIIFLYTSCNIQAESKSSSLNVIIKKNAIVLIADPTKSAILTYAQEKLTTEKVLKLVDKTALMGGADIYIYSIDGQCTNNQPLFLSIPGVPKFPSLKTRRVGDEDYENYKRTEITKFQNDSLIAAVSLDKLKIEYQKTISAFLNNAYKDSLEWTDAIGAINNAIAVLSSKKYDSYSYKRIIAFSDLEQSLPPPSKYQPKLEKIPDDIQVSLVTGTFGQKPILKNYQRIPNFEIYLSSNF